MDFIFRYPPNTKDFSEKRRFWTFLPTKSKKNRSEISKIMCYDLSKLSKMAVFEHLLIYLQENCEKITLGEFDFVGKKTFRFHFTTNTEKVHRKMKKRDF